MKRFLTVLMLVAATTAGTASAQLSDFTIGPRVGYDFDWEALSVGVDARAGFGTLPVDFNVTLDYFFLEDVDIISDEYSQSLFKFTANAIYEFGIDNQAFTPYAGGGLAITRYSAEYDAGAFGSVDASDTNVGLNVMGGAYFGSGSMRPFAQLYLTLGDGSTVGATAGLLFAL